MVVQADNTLTAIRLKVRRLTASSSESALPTDTIDQYINTFYNNDFPYAIKLDQMRSVYTFYTRPYIDRYPLDVNYNQGIRAPVYVDGVQGYFYKDRDQFFNMWPRWPTLFQQAATASSGYAFTTGQGPILSQNINIGGIDVRGNPISIGDDGNGNLQLQIPNPQISVPPQTSSAPGMKNLNTANPGQDNVITIGSVNYQTASFAFTLPVNFQAGSTFRIHVVQYNPGKPYTLLFWNNELTIRPVPKFCHKIEVETYLTPVQFLATTDSPILNQWWQYIAIGAAIKVLEDRQDMEGIQNLSLLFDRQEGLVLERQGVEEIGQRNTTIFAGTQQNLGWNAGFNQGWM